MGTPVAHATGHPRATLAALVAQSDLIVRGSVSATSAHPEGPGGESGIHSRAEIEVHEVLLGDTAIRDVEVWTQGGRIGGRMRAVVGQARFEVLEDVLVFIARDADGHLWVAGMSAGKRLVRPGERAEVEAVRDYVRWYRGERRRP